MRRLLLAAPIAIAAAAFAATATAGNHWSDPAGDSGAAPDVTSIDVSNDNTGTLTFVVTMAPRAAYAPDEAVQIQIDADQNPSTGSPIGNEYLLISTGSGWDFAHWDGTQFSPASAPTVHVSTNVSASAFTMTATVAAADLGGTKAFNFEVVTDKGTGADTDPFDVAPDASVYSYTLAAAPTVKILYAKVPRVVRPKHVLKVTGIGVGLSDGTRAAADAAVCSAKVGSRALPAVGACTFTVPAWAAGKKVTVRVAVEYGGHVYTVNPWTAKVAKK